MSDDWLPGWSAEFHPGAIVGYRGWSARVEGSDSLRAHWFRISLDADEHLAERWILASVGQISEHWRPGLNIAQCNGYAMCLVDRRSGGIPVPVPAFDHHCGLYITRELAEAEARSMGAFVVLGAVQGWGRGVEHHDEGWRMQFASILALLDPGYPLPRYGASSQLVQRIGELYDVPVLSQDDLQNLVEEMRRG